VTTGLAAGYFGGALDQLLSRFVDAMLAFPGILLAIAITNALGPSLINAMLAVGVINIPTYFRLTRGLVLQAREQEFVLAARVLGARRARIMARHILPNAMASALTFMPFVLNGSIVTLTSLDFLGFGLPPGSPSLGELLEQGKNNLQAPWLGLSGFVVVAVMLSLVVFAGEAVRDAFDPRKTLA
jgi:microcin C transport system permease protein